MAASPGTGAAATGTAFPYRSVVVLALVLTTNGYTLSNLFPYVGTMTKHLLGLSTTNESGEFIVRCLDGSLLFYNDDFYTCWTSGDV